MNQLFLGDNLEVLARHVGDASVDLVVLDPPFQSGKDYGLARRTRGCGQPTEPVFTDTWRWGPEADDSYRRVAESRSDAAVTLSAPTVRFSRGKVADLLPPLTETVEAIRSDIIRRLPGG